jgi:hypothetical protein
LIRVNLRRVCAGTVKLAGAYWSAVPFFAVSNGLSMVRMTPVEGVPEELDDAGDVPNPTGKPVIVAKMNQVRKNVTTTSTR